MHDVCISPDKRYRYWLEAKVSDDSSRTCMFLMLNPSTADATKSDPTMNACKRFAKDWGFGIMRVCNLFGLRTPYPEVLKNSRDPVGPENDEWVIRTALKADVIVCAWGNNGSLRGRHGQVRQMLEREGLSNKMQHLGLTKLGQPRHPLRLRADTKTVQYLN